MANLGYVVTCPYYRNEKKVTITCEDTIRSFRSPKHKQDQIERYCANDNEWRKCQYAARLEEVYRADGGEEALQAHYADARYRELLKMISEAGRKRKETERLVSERKELTAKLEASQKINHRLQAAEKRIREKMDMATKEINTLANLYEQIFAYLLTGSMAESLDIEAVDEWARHNEYRMIPEYGDNKKIVKWKCEVRPRDGSAGSSGETQSAGGKEAEGAGTETGEKDENAKQVPQPED